TQGGTTVHLSGVSVSNGLFTVQLDFGAASFNGARRWLQISVNGTPLSPRQELTATPYALHAAGPWITSGSSISYSAGNVGIGVANPAYSLDLFGDLRGQGRIAFGDLAEFGAGSGAFAGYERFFDFSQRIQDFSSSTYFSPLIS